MYIFAHINKCMLKYKQIMDRQKDDRQIDAYIHIHTYLNNKYMFQNSCERLRDHNRVPNFIKVLKNEAASINQMV